MIEKKTYKVKKVDAMLSIIERSALLIASFSLISYTQGQLDLSKFAVMTNFISTCFFANAIYRYGDNKYNKKVSNAFTESPSHVYVDYNIKFSLSWLVLSWYRKRVLKTEYQKNLNDSSSLAYIGLYKKLLTYKAESYNEINMFFKNVYDITGFCKYEFINKLATIEQRYFNELQKVVENDDELRKNQLILNLYYINQPQKIIYNLSDSELSDIKNKEYFTVFFDKKINNNINKILEVRQNKNFICFLKEMLLKINKDTPDAISKDAMIKIDSLLLSIAEKDKLLINIENQKISKKNINKI